MCVCICMCLYVCVCVCKIGRFKYLIHNGSLLKGKLVPSEIGKDTEKTSTVSVIYDV